MEKRVEIRPWSLLPGFTVCQGQVSAVKSGENYHCLFRMSSGGRAAPMVGRRSTTKPHLQLSGCTPDRAWQRDALSAYTSDTALHSNTPATVDCQVFPATPTVPLV